jgi:hypothetical protein
MSEVHIRRRTRQQTVAIGTTVDASSTVRFDDMAGGILHLGSPSSAVSSIAVFGSHEAATDFREVRDASGGPATIRVARQQGTAVATIGTTTAVVSVYTAMSNAYALPDVGHGLPFLRLVADADVGTAAESSVSLKS